jgi:hypothetical protein
MNVEAAIKELERCLKAHGLFGCLHGEVKIIRDASKLPAIDKEGYPSPWCASCDAEWRAMCARFDHTMITRRPLTPAGSQEERGDERSKVQEEAQATSAMEVEAPVPQDGVL